VISKNSNFSVFQNRVAAQLGDLKPIADSQPAFPSMDPWSVEAFYPHQMTAK
jgi:hypothetical protein